ncbi:MAG: hypothetical protein ACK6A7_22995, partial [Planctomycetota bacterium]
EAAQNPTRAETRAAHRQRATAHERRSKDYRDQGRNSRDQGLARSEIDPLYFPLSELHSLAAS